MKAPQLLTCLGLALAVLLCAGETRAFQKVGGPKSQPKNTVQSLAKADDPKYKFHLASSLSGIDLQPQKNDGTFILKFDQQLTENGTLQIKDTRGKIWYTNIIGPGHDSLNRTLNVGKLNPGMYSIEVKTAETTFWKKVRIKK